MVARNTATPEQLLQEIDLRARSRVDKYRPMSVAERLQAFARHGFRPHGVFLPSDDAQREKVRVILREIGKIDKLDDRLRRYAELQDATERLCGSGLPGKWTGQQAVARSESRFRLVAWGRRGGKTLYAANEAVAVAKSRPRSRVWVAAPTMAHVSRCFDLVEQLVQDSGERLTVHRNTVQHKLLILANGSAIEGVTLENTKSAVGAAVDLTIVDEAAQVGEDAWNRVILPPLADRNGHALLISSWEGESGFFFEKSQEAQADAATRGEESDWAFFQDASWDVNFYMFPQGRNSPAILAQERQMTNVDFLEQFGAIPAKAKGLVFPEFREKVHVGRYPFDPNHPVILATDPSGGANPYAVLALQDYGDRILVIDEFYESGMAVEDISPLLDKKPWRKAVVDMVIDSAMPVEVERWVRMGWPVSPVQNKPKVEDRLPLYRNLLRDPRRYAVFYRIVMNDLLRELGHGMDDDLSMTPDQQRSLAIQIEDITSDQKISDRHLAVLRGCARIFYDRSCAWTIREHKKYGYMKRRENTRTFNTKETPADAYNHGLDAVSYFTWMYHRTDGDTVDASPRTMVRLAGEEHPSSVLLPRPGSRPAERVGSFLEDVRATYTRTRSPIRSRIRTAV